MNQKKQKCKEQRTEEKKNTQKSYILCIQIHIEEIWHWILLYVFYVESNSKENYIRRKRKWMNAFSSAIENVILCINFLFIIRLTWVSFLLWMSLNPEKMVLLLLPLQLLTFHKYLCNIWYVDNCMRPFFFWVSFGETNVFLSFCCCCQTKKKGRPNFLFFFFALCLVQHSLSLALLLSFKYFFTSLNDWAVKYRMPSVLFTLEPII